MNLKKLTATILVRNKNINGHESRPHNSTYPKVAGQCEYEHLCFKQTLVRIDSLVFQTATFG